MTPNGSPLEIVRRQAPNSRFHDVDLTAAAFSDAKLAGATFDDVDLSGAAFDDARLRDAHFTNSDFSGATIDTANLTGMRIDGILVSELFDAYRSGRH